MAIKYSNPAYQPKTGAELDVDLSKAALPKGAKWDESFVIGTVEQELDMFFSDPIVNATAKAALAQPGNGHKPVSGHDSNGQGTPLPV